MATAQRQENLALSSRAGAAPRRAQEYCASAAAASSAICSASSGGEITLPSSPSRSASRLTHWVSGVRSTTASRPSPSSVAVSHG